MIFAYFIFYLFYAIILCEIFLYFRNTDVSAVSGFVFYNERRNLFESVVLCKLSVFFYKQLFKGNACLFKQRRRDLTVRAGFSCEEDCSGGLCLNSAASFCLRSLYL